MSFTSSSSLTTLAWALFKAWSRISMCLRWSSLVERSEFNSISSFSFSLWFSLSDKWVKWTFWTFFPKISQLTLAYKSIINTSASHWLQGSFRFLIDEEVHLLWARSCEMVLRLSSVPSQSFAASCLLAVSIRSVERKRQYHHTFPQFYDSKIWQCLIKFIHVQEIKSVLENRIPKQDHLCQTDQMYPCESLYGISLPNVVISLWRKSQRNISKIQIPK